MKYSKSKRFYTNGGPYGFGYYIIDKGEDMVMPYKKIFHTSDKEQLLEVFETIEENFENLEAPIQNWSPKILFIDEKHCTNHFLINSPEEVDVVAYKYIKLNYGTKYSRLVKWELPKDSITLSDVSYIDACPNKKLKDFLLGVSKSMRDNFKEYEKHNKLIDAVNALMLSNDKTGSYDLLSELDFLYDYISIVNPSN